MSTLTEVLPKAGLLEAAKRRGHVSLVVGVDEDGSGLQPLAHVQGFVDVSREHTGGKAKLCVVCSAQHAVNVTEEAKDGYGEEVRRLVWNQKLHNTVSLKLLMGSYI